MPHQEIFSGFLGGLPRMRAVLPAILAQNARRPVPGFRPRLRTVVPAAIPDDLPRSARGRSQLGLSFEAGGVPDRDHRDHAQDFSEAITTLPLIPREPARA